MWSIMGTAKAIAFYKSKFTNDIVFKICKLFAYVIQIKNQFKIDTDTFECLIK